MRVLEGLDAAGHAQLPAGAVDGGVEGPVLVQAQALPAAPDVGQAHLEGPKKQAEGELGAAMRGDRRHLVPSVRQVEELGDAVEGPAVQEGGLAVAVTQVGAGAVNIKDEGADDVGLVPLVDLGGAIAVKQQLDELTGGGGAGAAGVGGEAVYVQNLAVHCANTIQGALSGGCIMVCACKNSIQSTTAPSHALAACAYCGKRQQWKNVCEETCIIWRVSLAGRHRVENAHCTSVAMIKVVGVTLDGSCPNFSSEAPLLIPVVITIVLRASKSCVSSSWMPSCLAWCQKMRQKVLEQASVRRGWQQWQIISCLLFLSPYANSFRHDDEEARDTSFM